MRTDEYFLIVYNEVMGGFELQVESLNRFKGFSQTRSRTFNWPERSTGWKVQLN